jgi:processive 1,2-diacylglycerol beta-glucosyltransferase
MPADPPRILIVTAAFGEGHNSAAGNVSLALQSAGALTRVADPCLLGAPGITAVLSRGYRMVTNRLPRVWAMIYRSTDRCDFSRRTSPVMRFPEKALGALIDEFRPDALVSTYPLYPYFLKRIPQGIGARFPVFTIVTDSIEINAAWLRAPSDWWLVTDPSTRDAVIRKGLPPERVVDTGFPVSPLFAGLPPVDAGDDRSEFRILYFATASRSSLTEHGRALLDADVAVSVTIVLGRNVRALANAARELKREHRGRVRLIGWTKRVPQLLTTHHLVIGKAGGATVHEAIAAQCPMLIHHLVPGQEEGNLRLLEAIGAGGLATAPAAMEARVRDLLADNRSGWRSMKHSLARHGRNAGALAAARFILQTTASSRRKPA